MAKCFAKCWKPGNGVEDTPDSESRNEVCNDSMSKAIKMVWNGVTWLLVLVLLVLAVLLAGVRLVGLRPMTVLSGSMEPVYGTGDLIYVKEVDYRELKAGDVITFLLSEDTIATHRIVEIIPDEADPSVVRYRTKGDANESEDGSLVHCKNVVGTPVWSLPKLGYVANYIQNPPGSYIALSGAAVVLLLIFLPDLLWSEDAEQKPEKEKKTRKRGRKKGKFER